MVSDDLLSHNKEKQMNTIKELLAEAAVAVAQAAESIKAQGKTTANRQDALNALNDIVAIIEDEVIPALEVEA